MPGDLILVYFLENQQVGYEFVRTREDWPMHITLVPWFGSADPRLLETDLQKLAHGIRPFTVTLGEEQKLNPETTVHVVADSVEIRRLHEALMMLSEAAGGKLRTDRWILGRYKAHVTHHETQPLPQTGGTYTVGAFWLVSLLPGRRCKVVAKFELGTSSETTA